MTLKQRRRWQLTAVFIALAIASAFVIVPVLWMFSTSIKTIEEMFSLPLKWIPDTVSWDAYKRIWTDYPFGRYIFNSLFVVSGATIISLLVSCLAGYGASRFRFLGRTAFLTFLLITQMFPSIMLLIPYFKLMKTLGLINTYGGLILAYVSFTIPLASWLMLGYFESIPKELDAAASIDGASRFRIFWQIIMPLALPGAAATAIYAFIVGWNEYIFALVLASDVKMKTVPVGIGELIGQYRIAWNDMMAVALVVSIPLIAIFLYLQKYLVSSLTAGAVKG